MKSFDLASFVIVVIMSAIAKFVEDIYSPMALNIADSFNITKQYMQQAASIYFMGFVFGVLLFGFLSDIIGRKICAMLGFAIMILGIIILSYSLEFEYFLLGKFLQGVGASISSILTQAISRDVLSGKDLSKMYADVARGMVAIYMLGPILGGQFVNFFDWRDISYFMIAVLLIAILLTKIFLPETLNINPDLEVNNKESENKKPDNISNKTKDLNLNNISKNKLSKYSISEKLKIFYINLINMMQDSNILIRGFIIGLCGSTTFGIMYESPFFYMDLLNLTSEEYSILYVLNGLSFLASGFITSRMLKTHNALDIIKKIIKIEVFASIIFLFGLYYLSQIKFISNIVIIFFSCGLQFVITALATVISNNTMSSTFQTKRNIGISTSILVIYYYSIISLMIFLISNYSVRHIMSMPVLIVVFVSLKFFVFHLGIKKNKII